MSRIAELGRRDLEAAGELLAQAFRDNPLNRAVVERGSARRLRCNRHGMRASLSAAFGASTLLGISDEKGPKGKSPLRGVLLALSPGAYPLAGPSLGVQLRCLLGQGFRVAGRWGEVYRALEAVHPPEPHWYLSLLGVEPGHRRQGRGGALLRRWLEQVDREGAPSYLETDRPENVDFYGQAGFAVRLEVSVLGVPVWCMWRPSRAGD